MHQPAVVSFMLISLLIYGCHSQEPSSSLPDTVAVAAPQLNSTKPGDSFNYPEVNTDTISCEDLDNPAVIYALALEEQENDFPAFDQLDFFTVRGHFSSTESEQILIRIESHAGVSCGTCCNMLLLYSCENKIRKIWSGYTGNFTRENIRDLNQDGLLEIESGCGFTWSCTLGERLTIFNLANGKEHVLYESYSENYMNEACGDQMRAPYRNGDTISYFFHDKLIDPDEDGIYEVRRIRESNLFRGGKTEAEMNQRMQTVMDTVIVALKDN